MEKKPPVYDTKPLPKEITEKLGGERLAYIVAVDRDGNQQLYAPDHIKVTSYRENSHCPTDAKKINRIEASSTVVYEKNPTCIRYCMVSGGMWMCHDICFGS